MTLMLEAALKTVASTEMPPRLTLGRLNRVPILQTRLDFAGGGLLSLNVVDDPQRPTGEFPRCAMDGTIMWWGVARRVTHASEIPQTIGMMTEELYRKLLATQ